MRRVLIAILATGLMPVICLPASAHSHKEKRRHVPRVERDCTPINGFYGYYGNPWCDTGSYRPPDIEFRERRNFNRRHGRSVQR